MKRYHKLQEFPAHATSVNCLKIGRKSSGVLVTGGEDKKVNVWAIGKSSAILTLQGHQSPVDCVAFDVSEEVVVAGATNGTIKMWDLDQAKVTRTLTGHRSNCLCVDFHPYGACLASGSLDTNIKIWDTRRRLCLSTLKGHTKGVTHVKFSPDGKWIVSGSENGEVKLWNIEAGKLFHDFKKHDNAVTGLDFHPREYILASCSADKTVRLWDIDTLETIDILGGECHGVRTAMFHPDGQHLLTALQDGLRVWSWEPALQCDNVGVEWSRIADISIVSSHTRLVGCSYNANMVGVWYIDLNVVQPWSQNHDGSGGMPMNGIYPTPQLITEEPPAAIPTPVVAPTQITGVMNPLTRALSPGRQMSKQRLQLVSPVAEGNTQSGTSGTTTVLASRNAADRHTRISDSGIASQADVQRKPASLNHARTSDSNMQVDPPSNPKPTPLSSRENIHPVSSRAATAAAADPNPPVVVKRRSASNHTEYTSSTKDTPEPRLAAQSAPLSHRDNDQAPLSSRERGQAPGSRRSGVPRSSPSLLHRQATTPSSSSTAVDDTPAPVEQPVPIERPQRRTSSLTQPSAGGLGIQRSTSDRQRSRSSSFPQVEIHVPAGPPPVDFLQTAPDPMQTPFQVEDPFSMPMPSSSRGRPISSRHVSPLREMPMSARLEMQMSAPRISERPLSPPVLNAIHNAYSAPHPVSGSFRPVSPVHMASTSVPSVPPPVAIPAATPEEQTLQMMRGAKETLLPQWHVRASNMSLIKTFLTRNNVTGALSALKRHADVYLMAVILEVLMHNKAAITLDSITDYVPLLDTLFSSPEEHHYKVGLGMLSTIMLHFGQYIRDTIAHGNGGMRVDLTGEQRREKCVGIRTKLSTLVGKLAMLPRGEPELARQAEDLMLQLEQL